MSNRLTSFAGIATGVATAAFGAMIKSQLKQIDLLGKSADKLGIGYRYAAKLSGLVVGEVRQLDRSDD